MNSTFSTSYTKVFIVTTIWRHHSSTLWYGIFWSSAVYIAIMDWTCTNTILCVLNALTVGTEETKTIYSFTCQSLPGQGISIFKVISKRLVITCTPSNCRRALGEGVPSTYSKTNFRLSGERSIDCSITVIEENKIKSKLFTYNTECIAMKPTWQSHGRFSTIIHVFVSLKQM
jgi:hypothetical protein